MRCSTEQSRNTAGMVSTPEMRAACARLAEAGAAGIGAIGVDQLRSATRGSPRHAELRQLAMYLANVVFGLNYTEVGLCFGRDRTTVRHACALVEDRRDDRRLDRAMAALESSLSALERRLIAECGRLAGVGA